MSHSCFRCPEDAPGVGAPKRPAEYCYGRAFPAMRRIGDARLLALERSSRPPGIPARDLARGSLSRLDHQCQYRRVLHLAMAARFDSQAQLRQRRSNRAACRAGSSRRDQQETRGYIHSPSCIEPLLLDCALRAFGYLGRLPSLLNFWRGG